MIFAPSKRQLTADEAREILDMARSEQASADRQPEAVGVFVNAPADEVNRVADYCELGRIQLHGDETLGILLTHRAARLQGCQDRGRGEGATTFYQTLDEELGAIVAAGHTPMLDTVSKGSYYGGTGQPFDWSLSQLRWRRSSTLCCPEG